MEARLLDFMGSYGYPIIFILMLIEGTGLPGVPFEPFFVTAGMLIGAGKMSFPGALLAGTAGNLAGNLVGYAAGYHAGRYLVQRYGMRLGLTGPRLARVERWFRRYGAGTVLLARWIGPIRSPAILGAGLAGMELRAYAFYSALGALGWNFFWLLLSIQVGRVAALVLSRWKLIRGPVIILIIFLFLAAYWWLKYRPGPNGPGA